MLSQPLTEPEFDRLDDLLQKAGGVHGMNVEAVDGFFAALICGPELVLPSEYLPEIWRGDSHEDSNDTQLPFDSLEEAQETLDLLTRHWNSIAETLSSGEIFVPLLDSDVDGVALGNDWAWGFMCGVELRHDAWQEMFDEDNMQLLIPILALFYENDPDPEMRPYQEPVNKELREKLIVGLSLSTMEIYKHFQPARRRDAEHGSRDRRSSSKVGRNQMCPCGSGKKYKRCCGNQTLQ